MKNANKIKFEHLAPVSNIPKEDTKVFDEAMDFALKDENIHNIAVTGSYGAGKSSLIKSYEKHHDYKFLNISLATFEIKKNMTNQNVEQTDYLEEGEPTEESADVTIIPFSMLQRIEKSILQQMFYKESFWKLPFSRFRRIRNITWWQTGILILFVWGIIIFPSAILDQTGWKYIARIAFFKDSILLGAFLWLFVVCASLGIAFIIRFCNKITLSKIGLKNVDIDLDIKDKNSLLNKYLDEVLYFFEATDYNVVVFEDLDRFENAEIFIKLRELNSLLNNSKKIITRTRKKVTFIYALKDEVFTDSKRTKFFEFIIPVIPIINNQNSCDILLNIKKNNPESALTDIDDHFLMDIGLYVSDMRLLKNCINEFKIYEQIVNKDIYSGAVSLDNCKLAEIRTKIFALVLYKNLYPEDFALLQENNGYLFEIFYNKAKAIKNQKKVLEDKIKAYNDEIKSLADINKDSIEDLRRLYILKLIELTSNFVQLQSIDYLSDSVFEKLQNENKITINYAVPKYNPRGYSNVPVVEGVKNDIPVDFNKIQNSVDPKQSYKEKEEIILQKQNGREQELKVEIQKCENEIKALGALPLAVIINQYNDTSFIENDETINKELVVYLLRYSYIDEHYFDYISYFYPGALSRTDKEFLLLLRNHGEPDFAKELNNIETVIERIQTAEWKNPAVLNNSLLSYILTHKTGHLKEFIQTMFEYDAKNSFSFFSQYTNDNQNALQVFYSKVYDFVKNKKNWVNVLLGAADNEHLFDFFMLVDFGADEHIKNLLSSNISVFYRPLDKDHNAIVANKLKALNVHFELDNKVFDNDIGDIIIKNNLYDLSKENLIILINWKNNLQKEDYDDYLTQISHLNDEYIKKYVNDNLEVVLENVIFEQETINESEDVSVSIIQNKDICIDNTKKFIELNECKISSISKVSHYFTYKEEGNEEELKFDVWSLLLDNNKIICSWENVLSYYQGDSKGKVHILSVYLNNFEKETYMFAEEPLSKEELKDDKNPKYQLVRKFYAEIVLNNDELCVNSFKLLIEQSPFAWKSLENYSINSEKLRYMIEAEKLSLNKENYDGIKVNQKEMLPLFISSYIDNQKIFELLTGEDIIAYITDESIKPSRKFKLLSNEFPLLKTINNALFFEKVANLVVSNNYKKAVCVDWTVGIGGVINSLEIENILQFVLLQIDCWNKQEIEKIFSKLPKPYNELIQKSRSVMKINDSEINKKILEKLKSSGFVTSYSVDRKNKLVVRRKQK
ncbi:MAG: hypothetical protein J6J00_04095 [Treponema sp.]|nr:hypothetical protein [Treponema sp.]